MLIERFGHRPASSIVLADIEDIQEWLRNKRVRKNKVGYEGKTINDFCSLFERIMDRAVSEGLLPANPVQGYKREKETPSKKIRRPLDEDQWNAFYPQLKDGWLKDSLLAYLHTGCRKMELVSINWDQIHLDSPSGDYMEVVNRPDEDDEDGFEAKSEAGVRRVPISPAVRRILERNKLDARPYPFPGPNGRISGNTVYNRFKTEIIRYNAKKETKIKIRNDTRLHDLRHTFGTWSARKVPLPTLKTIMGHTSISQTADYCEQDSETAIQDFHKLGPFNDTARTS
jgi:integrase